MVALAGVDVVVSEPGDLLCAEILNRAGVGRRLHVASMGLKLAKVK